MKINPDTTSYDDASNENFYEEVESVMSKVNTPYTVLMGDFNAKVRKNQAADQAVRVYGIGTRNSKEDS